MFEVGVLFVYARVCVCVYVLFTNWKGNISTLNTIDT